MATNLLSVLLLKYSSVAKNSSWYYDYLLKINIIKHLVITRNTQNWNQVEHKQDAGLQWISFMDYSRMGVILFTQSKQTCTRRVPAGDMWLVLHLLFSFPPCLPYHQHLNNLGWWNGKDLGFPSLRVYLETFRGTKQMKSSKGRNNKGRDTLDSLECWLSVLSSCLIVNHQSMEYPPGHIHSGPTTHHCTSSVRAFKDMYSND